MPERDYRRCCSGTNRDHRYVVQTCIMYMRIWSSDTRVLESLREQGKQSPNSRCMYHTPPEASMVPSLTKPLISGDRVGFGYVKGGCGHCERCSDGDYFYCEVAPRNYSLSDRDQGSFSTYAVWPETNLHIIPDNISSAHAAPFLCAGLTVFTPMVRYGIKPKHHVGIVGIGGLGHLAIQFAAKLGAKVTVFSNSATKKEEALELGATDFCLSKDLKGGLASSRLDYLIVTATGHPDWDS
jgi:D-arabinose 1-dehydrogenase-like Zn-dependent alcohol dehydrogenase